MSKKNRNGAIIVMTFLMIITAMAYTYTLLPEYIVSEFGNMILFIMLVAGVVSLRAYR